MSYIPTEWRTGDIVTAEKLNKLENGINNNALIIELIFDTESDAISLNKTYSEIKQAVLNNSKIYFLKIDAGNVYYSSYISLKETNGLYEVYEDFTDQNNKFTTTDVNGYPEYVP